MSEPPRDPFKLTGQRLFLIALVAVALALAAMTIAASLNVWRQNDAIVTSAPKS